MNVRDTRVLLILLFIANFSTQSLAAASHRESLNLLAFPVPDGHQADRVIVQKKRSLLERVAAALSSNPKKFHFHRIWIAILGDGLILQAKWPFVKSSFLPTAYFVLSHPLFTNIFYEGTVVAVSSHGGILISIKKDKVGTTVYVANQLDGRLRRDPFRIASIDSVAGNMIACDISADNQFLIIASVNQNLAQIVDLEKGVVVHFLETKFNIRHVAAYGRDSPMRFITADERNVVVWNLEAKKKEWDQTVPEGFEIVAISFVREKHIPVVVRHGEKLKILPLNRDLSENKALYNPPVHLSTALHSSSYPNMNSETNIDLVTLSQDGVVVAAVWNNYFIRVWDSTTGMVLDTFEGRDVITGLAVSKALLGSFMIAVSYIDGTKRIWRIYGRYKEDLI